MFSLLKNLSTKILTSLSRYNLGRLAIISNKYRAYKLISSSVTKIYFIKSSSSISDILNNICSSVNLTTAASIYFLLIQEPQEIINVKNCFV